MKKLFLLIMALCIVVPLAVTGCMPTPPTPTPTPTPGMEKDFTLLDLNGRSFTLSDHLGKPIVLCFFMSNCPACKSEVPHLNSVHQKYVDSEELMVIGIGIRAGIAEFVQSQGVQYLVLQDDENETVSDLYGVWSVPHNVFINRQWKITRQIAQSLSESELEQYIDEIL
ncbi:MAG: TlpA disulfide reductase family protein [Atribacterota bacterium]|nr:TlpA disulfide reductase family protein [Atribacterota bacterium]